MYAMLQNGLICMGSSKLYYPKDHALYTDSLGNGCSFGKSFLYYLNSQKYNPNHQSLALIGAGTLKFQPYIPAALPSIIIDSIWLETTDASPYLIHGDTLILHAKISSSDGAIDTNLIDFKWYGVSDSASGNHVSFILDGHNAPTYDNSCHQGTYTIVLHAECTGYLSAVKTIEFDGWHFKTIGKSFDALNRHEKSAEGWNLRMRGRTGNIGSTEDDFLFYCRPIYDNSFKITALPEAFENMTTPSAKTGVMIRNGSSNNDDAHVFIGVQNNNTLVFQYRPISGDTTTTNSFAGYNFGNTWVRLKKIFNKVYGFVSTDGINYTLVDSVEASVFNNLYAGFAYSCDDTSKWAAGNERWAVLGKKDIAVIDTIEPLPVVYASDSIVTLDRVQLNSISMGAGILFSSNMDCQFNGNINVDGNAAFRDRSVINGTIKLSGYLSLINGAIHNGDLYESTNVGFSTIPVKTVPVGDSSVYVGSDETLTLSSGGIYNDVTVGNRGHLILDSGVYNMGSFILDTDAKLTVNDTVEINVNSDFSINDRVILTVSSINNLKIYTNDPVFSIGEMTFKGRIVAPHARITLKSRINYRGSIKGKVLFFDSDAKLFDY